MDKQLMKELETRLKIKAIQKKVDRRTLKSFKQNNHSRKSTSDAILVNDLLTIKDRGYSKVL
jgi:hypothetical protein